MSYPTLFQGFSVDHFRVSSKDSVHRSQSLDLNNGFRTMRTAGAPAGFVKSEPHIEYDTAGDVIKLGCLNPEFYRDPPNRATRAVLQDEKAELHARNSEPPNVLRFYAYYVDNIPQEKPFLAENWRVRSFVIYFYIEDGTIRVWENREGNSGFVQGAYLRRKRFPMPGKQNRFYEWHDLDIGVDVELAGQKFHIYDCDAFTRSFAAANGSTIRPSETRPQDPYLEYRTMINQPPQVHKDAYDFELAKFLKLDGIILSFSVSLDERNFPAGDLRKMVLRYFVYDDTIELSQILEKNSGYDPARAVIRRQKVPKNFLRDIVRQIGDKSSPEYYTHEDLRIGDTLLLFGKKVTVLDCDNFTRDWFRQNGPEQPPGIAFDNIVDRKDTSVERKLNPWHPMHRQGGHDDSLQNCLTLIPQPPRRNYLKQLHFQREELRFAAQLVTQDPCQAKRRFILSYFVGDETVQIMEVPVPKVNEQLRKFMSRRRLLKPGRFNPPEYYSEGDYTLGSVHYIEGQHFQIIDCDAHVVNFVKEHPGCIDEDEIRKFERLHTDNGQVEPNGGLASEGSSYDDNVKEARNKLARLHAIDRRVLYRAFFDHDKANTRQLNAQMLMEMCRQLAVTEDESVVQGLLESTGCPSDGVIDFAQFLYHITSNRK